jgi:AraC-like DNA-binding protein
MDVLSDVLLAVRLTGAIFFDIEARSPFAAESPPVHAISDRVMAGAGHVITFHTMLEGACWAEAFDLAVPPFPVGAGEIIVYPLGDPNVLSSTPGMRGTPDPALYYRPADRLLPFPLKMNQDGAADKCRFVCGFFGCDARPFNPLLNALPRILHAPLSAPSRALLESLVGIAVKQGECESAGREAMLAKIAELMFVEVMRNHIDRLPQDARGWFAGLRDPQIGAALRLIHGQPSAPWTLDGLAREIGMSRSSFAERFTAYMGMPAMQYLGRWRLQIAARLLETPSISIAQAAAEVGYQSEAAFNRAFKRYAGVAPGAWRRERKEPATTAGEDQR